MDLVNEDEIKSVIIQCGFQIPIKWYFEEFQEKVIGYLGEHLKLVVEVEKGDTTEKLRFFVKLMPRKNKWLSEYLKEVKFFSKEYVMLSSLFPQFKENEGKQKWRPKLFYSRKDLFIFEDVGNLGYVMPHHRDTMSYNDLKATVETIAKFHAASYIFEEEKSLELNRAYRIWEHYSEFLQEPVGGQTWRDTGRNAIIEFLKAHSKYKHEPNTLAKAESIIPKLYDRAMVLMKPSIEHRNVVVHRDIWTNNILLKRQTKFDPHAIIVDFQTVLYCSPMLDLSSLIYFNTNRAEREKYTSSFFDIYISTLSTVLLSSGIYLEDIFPKKLMTKSYNESIVFAITQSSLIVPITTMSSEKRDEIFNDPAKAEKANVVSRSEEFIEIAENDAIYRHRVCDLFEEIVDRYVIMNDKNINVLTDHLGRSDPPGTPSPH